MRSAPACGEKRSKLLTGVACTLAAYFVFVLHDACVKLLVADLGLPPAQVLFVRGAVILPLLLVAGGRVAIGRALASPARGPLLLSGPVYAAAWLADYAAIRHLQLAELETIYFASPLLIAVLAIPLLKERVTTACWVSLALGFAGVVLACNPGELDKAGPVALALLGTVLWSYTVILMRQVAVAESTVVQMLVANLAFLVICGAAMPWLWHTPDAAGLMLLLLVGLLGALGQCLLHEGLRHAAASVAAPLEYSSLLWSFILTYLVWNEIPAAPVFGGAGLVLLSGLIIVAAEWRSARKTPAAGPPTPFPYPPEASPEARAEPGKDSEAA